MGSAAPGLAAVGRCPACAAPERTPLFETHDWIYGVPGRFSLVRCACCASVYPDPAPGPRHLALYYPEDEYYSYSTPARYRLYARRDPIARLWYATARGVLRRDYGYEHLGGSTVLAAAAGRLPTLRRRATFSLGTLLHPSRPDGALLDVGCGSGRYLDLMRALGWSRVVGVDIAASAVALARSALDVEAYAGELEDIGFPTASFDAVSLSHTLEHVPDPVRLLAEVRRVAKPGARIVIVVPNVGSLVSRLLGERWLGWDAPRHLVNFSRLGLQTAMIKGGLSIRSLESSPEGSYGVALFSVSRARGDPREVYTDERHRFPPRRRALAALLAAAERALCAAGCQRGELLCAVAEP